MPRRFEPVLDAVVAAIGDPEVAVLLYGSVATGRARSPESDVDLVTVGLAPEAASVIGPELSARFAHLCRGVELGPAQLPDGDGDQAYGDRVFLRHYCVHVAGPDVAAGWPAFPADARAARGFNGDLARHVERWRRAEPGPALARRVGRKTLLAAAGLVSVHDGTWTTDRATAATRWGEIDPTVAAGLRTLLAWSEGGAAGPDEVCAALDGPVAAVVAEFEARIGLW